MWLSVMERYIYLNQQRKINIAIRYEDLVAKPEKIITWLFQELGLPITQVSEACQLLNHDSQEGSNLSKQKTHYNQVENLNSLEICNQVNNLLKQHPIITKSDFIVPDTLGYTHQT
jgi:DNA-binding transcriptional MerR regulator